MRLAEISTIGFASRLLLDSLSDRLPLNSESDRSIHRRLILATTMYFEETILDQGGKISLDIELGRSSYYPEDSIYLKVDGKTVIMDLATAQRFVGAVMSVGHYHGLVG